jgi:tetratricopeptide (TPR) repeat protein
MQYRYRQPHNEDAFEEFCLTLLREHWSLPTLQRYGHRGEQQDGVDLFDVGGRSPIRGVQCKHHDVQKTLPPKELEAEVIKARNFPEKLDEFYVLTSAKKSTQAQRKVQSINKDHAAKGLFTVHLLTWDDIERITDHCPSAQEALAVQAPQVVRRMLKAELQPIQESIRGQGNDLHGAGLDEVKENLEDGQLQIAEHLLSRLRSRSWDQMSNRTRFRWSTLHADLEIRKGNPQSAAQSLLAAKGFQPDDEVALQNEITAYELLGDRTKAGDLAAAALQATPYSGSVYASAVRTAPGLETFRRLMDQRPEHLKDDAEIWMAVTAREDLAIPLSEVEHAARRATALAPDDGRGWSALAGVLMETEFDKLDPEARPSGDAPIRSRVEEARECLTKFADLSRSRGIPGLRATALIRRATTNAFLGDVARAHQDIEEARHLAPKDVAVAVAAARMEGERGNHTAAIQILREVAMREQGQESQSHFFLGIALWNRNAPGDRVEAANVLGRFSIASTVHVEPATELTVEGLVAQGQHGNARAHVDRVAAKLDACVAATLLAKISNADGQGEAASARATEAISKISPGTSTGTLRKLGKLLVVLGRVADSIPIWERLLVKTQVNDDTRSLVECLGRLGRDDKVLEVCAAARAAGNFDQFLLQWELGLLDRYDPGAALAVLNEYVAREPDNKRARLHLVHLAIRLGKPEIAQQQLAQLPPVTDVDAEEGAAVVAALSKLGDSEEAVTYAYDLLRRFFQDHHAHRAFRDAMLQRISHEQEPEPSSETPPTPQDAAPGVEVAPGMAVCLEEADLAPEWFVLEDSNVEAVGVENELAQDAPLRARLLGKKVGDEVVLSVGPGLRRTATVRDILPKVVFRIRDVWNRWQYRFPDHQEMWMVKVKSDDKRFDFSSFIELAREQQRRSREAEALYARQPIPVHLFGKAIGKNEVQALGHIAGADGLMLRCCLGTAEEYAEASTALGAAAEVVLDITALTTLLMLEELDVLDKLGKGAVVTHSTVSAMRQLVDEARGRLKSPGSLGVDEDGPRLVVTTPEGRLALLQTLERALKTVEEKCQSVGSPGLAALDREERTTLEDIMGASMLESAMAAAAAGRLLWTDDGVATHIVRLKFGTKRVWTQGVFRHLNDQGVVANDRYATVSARLLGWGYMFTSVNPQVIRTAGNQAEWSPDRIPLKQTLAYLSLDEVRNEDAAFLSAALVAGCYLDSVLPETRHAVVQAAGEALTKRSGAEKSLAQFGNLLTRVFGLNVPARDDAIRTFSAWHREYLRRLISIRRP